MPDPVIPYVIGDGFSDTQHQEILSAIEEWNERTVIALLARTAQEEYVPFQKEGCCRADLGRPQYEAVTNIWQLHSNCSVSAIVHEIGHAIGLGHEHQRLDRNAYLDMHFQPSPEISSDSLASYASAAGIRKLFNIYINLIK